MTRKLLCIFLSLCMLFSLFPCTVAAEEILEENNDPIILGSGDTLAADISNAITSGKQLELNEDLICSETLTINVPVGKELTLDGNGHEVRPSAAMDTLFDVTGGGTLTLCNIRFTCTGENETYASIAVRCIDSGADAANLTLDNVEIYGWNSNSITGVSFGNGYYTLNVRNCRIFQDELNQNPEETFNGITIYTDDADCKVSAILDSDGDETGWYTYVSNITVAAYDGNDPDITVNAGYYGCNVADYLPSPLKVCNQMDDSCWFDVSNDYEQTVAEVNGYPYASLGDALSAVSEDGAEINLLKDIEITAPIRSELQYDVSIYGNGNQIIYYNSGINEALNLTVSGEHSVEINDLTLNGSFLELHGSSANYNVNNCSFIDRGANDSDDAALVYIGNDCTADFNNCDFGAKNIGTSDNVNLNLNECVNIGTVWGNYRFLGMWYCNCSHVVYGNSASSDTAPSSDVCAIGAGTYGFDPETWVNAEEYTIANSESTWTVSVKESAAVAKIDAEYFQDLNRAVGHVPEDGTIELIAPFRLDECVRMDNGKAFTIVGNYEDTVIRAPQDFNEGFNDYGTGAMIYVGNGTKVTFSHINMNAYYHCGYCIAVDGDENSLATIDDCVFRFSNDTNVHGEYFEETEESPAFYNLVIQEGCFTEPYGNSGAVFQYAANDVGTEEFCEAYEGWGNYRYDEETDTFSEIEDGENFEGERFVKYYNFAPSYVVAIGDAYAAPAGTYILRLSLHNLCPIAGAALCLEYDTEIFTDPAVTYGEAFLKYNDNNIPVTKKDEEKGIITFAWLQETNLAQGTYSDFVTIVFQVKDDITEQEFSMQLSINKAANPDYSYKNSCRINDAGETVAVTLNTYDWNGETRYLPGDVDGDLSLTIADVQYLLTVIVGYDFDSTWVDGNRTNFDEAKFLLAGDVDGDACITIVDAVKVLRAMLQYDEALQ